MLLEVAVTHNRYSCFESIPTYVVKKTQLWGVQSFLSPLLWLFAPDADFLLSLFVLGADEHRELGHSL